MASTVLAQTNYWQPLNLPRGDAVTCFLHTGSSTVFCGTRESGVFRSSDNGGTWTAINTSLTNLKILSLFLAPGGELYAGTMGSGFFKSTNNGTLWAETGALITPATVTGMAALTNGTVIAATFKGIYRPGGFGGWWQNYKKGIGEDSINCLLLNANGHIFAGALTSGIFRSTDNGTNFTKLTTGLPDVGILSLAVSPTGTLYAGSEGAGLFKSNDNGNTWTQINLNSSYKIVHSVAVTSAGHIYAALNVGILRSIDNGNTWTQASSSLTNTTVFCVTSNSQGHVFIGTWGGKIFRSIDGGQTFTTTELVTRLNPVHSLYMTQANQLYAGVANDGLFVSTDRGSTWAHISLYGIDRQIIDVKCIIPTSNGGLLVGTELFGMFLSTDGGTHWKLNNAGIGSSLVYGYSLTKSATGNIFLGTGGSSVFRSGDNGQSWQAAGTGLTNSTILTLLSKPSGEIFAGTANGGVFLTTTEGNNWTAINNGLANKFVNALATNTAGDLFAGTSGDGIFRSSNNGTAWTKVIPTVTQSPVMCMTSNSLGYMFAGCTNAGVYRSRDNGGSWSAVNSGLTNKNVNALALDSDGYLYAATDAGVFKSTAASTATYPAINVSASTISFGSVQINTTATRQLDIENTGDANLTINNAILSPGNDFSITLTTPITLTPGQKTTAQVKFSPKAAGAQTGSITLSSNDPSSPNVTINLTGTGSSQPKPKIVVTQTTYDYGKLVVGVTKRLYIRIENQGSATLTIQSATLSGAQASMFTVITTTPRNILANGRDSLAVEYTAGAKGIATAQLDIRNNDTDQGSVLVQLRGEGLKQADMKSYTTDIDFGKWKNADPPVPRTLVFENTGDVPLTVTGVTLEGSHASSFQLTRTLPPSMQPAVKDTVIITFDPTLLSVGAKSASLVVESQSANNPRIDIPLMAEVLSSATVHDPAPASFGIASSFPNPFAHQSTIRLTIDENVTPLESEFATLVLEDVLGRTISARTRALSRTNNGFDLRITRDDLPQSGTYFYRIAVETIDGNRIQFNGRIVVLN